MSRTPISPGIAAFFGPGGFVPGPSPEKNPPPREQRSALVMGWAWREYSSGLEI